MIESKHILTIFIVRSRTKEYQLGSGEKYSYLCKMVKTNKYIFGDIHMNKMFEDKIIPGSLN